MAVGRRFFHVAVVAVISRLFILTLQVVFNFLIPDHNANVFITPDNVDYTIVDKFISFLFGGLTRWDAQYFLHIAKYGYTYENTLAFFPLYPFLVYYLGLAFHCFFSCIASFHTSLLLAGVFINFALFIVACICLFELSSLVLGDEKVSYLVAFLFCINPASIFFSACYSESLFSALTFAGLLCVEKNRTLSAALVLGLSGATRSNGLVNGGFLLYAHLREVIKILSTPQDETVRSVFSSFLRLTVNLFLFLFPFVAYQVYACLLYCMPNEQLVPSLANQIYDMAKKNGYRMPSDQPAVWCNQLLPFSYSYVQKTYWNVGFLKYFEVKQFPNFLLAGPVLIIVGRSCYTYFKDVFTLMEFSCIGVLIVIQQRNFVYFVHAAALLIFCTLFIHIQVTTRLFASSSPILFWVAATWIKPELERVAEKFEKEKHRLHYFIYCVKSLFQNCTAFRYIFIYFSTYSIIGTLLHVNFLPWT